MSAPHDDLRDDLPAYALGTLDSEGSMRVERHLGNCAECRQALHEYEEVMRLLPLGLPRTEPSPSARRQLLGLIRTTETASKHRTTQGWWSRVRLHVLTAAAVVIVVLAGALFWTLSGGSDNEEAAEVVADLRMSPDTQIVSMLGSANAPQAVAQLFFQPGETQAGLVVSGLQPLPDNRAYQLWFTRPDETRYSGGVFNVDSEGNAIVVIDAPAAYAPGWSCGVTEEPAGGSDQPTGRNVLRGSYEDYDW